MPAMVFLCIVLLLVGWFLGVFSVISKDTIVSLLYLSNWTRAFSTGSPMYLGHTWSLSIEEQFYLFWPMLLIPIMSKYNRKGAIFLTVFLFLTSFFWQLWLANRGAEEARIYNGLDVRMGGLLMGCFLGLFLENPRKIDFKLSQINFLKILSWIGGLSILIFFILFQMKWSPWSSFFIWCASVMLIFSLAINKNSIFWHILSNPVLVLIGKMSYGIYLWHYPVVVILSYNFKLNVFLSGLVGIPISFICASLSYVLIEKPSLRLRDYFSGKTMQNLGFSTASLSITGMLTGILIFFSDDIIQFINPSPLKISAYGPTQIRLGEKFNVQTNVESVMWITISHSIRDGVTVFYEDYPLQTVVHDKTISAFIPFELLKSVGKFKISLRNAKNELVTDAVLFEILN